MPLGTRHVQERLAATTWWLLGLSFALSASLSNQIPILVLLCAAMLVTCWSFAKPEQRTKAFPLYLGLAVFVVMVRLVFRVIFNQPATTDVALNLPRIAIRVLDTSVSFLGPVSMQSLEAAAIDGLRLAGIVLGIGLANTLANPRRLLKSTPPALYELAAAAAVAINLAPELIQSLQRVRLARRLRGQELRWWQLSYLVIPVLEDSIERSLKLAAGMDSRGFGRAPATSRSAKLSFQLLTITSLCAFSTVSYLALAGQQQTWVLAFIAVFGIGTLASSIAIAGKSRIRTRYPGEQRTWRDLAVALLAISMVAWFISGAPNSLELMQWKP
ncbi:MAG: CbiQ family ECF transporter T component [Micrococcales bacterium]